MSFQNTFAPLVENQELTVAGIIQCLFIGAIRYEDIPKHIRPFVDEEMKKRTEDQPIELQTEGVEPEATQEARPPQKQFATGKSHNIPSYLDKALDDYLKKKQSTNKDYEDLNYTIERIVEAQEGHWVTIKGTHIKIEKGQSLNDAMKAQGIDAEDKGMDVKDKPLIKPEKRSLFHKPKKSAFKPDDMPAAEGRDFEPIIKSNAPTAEHSKTANEAYEAHPDVFSGKKDFLLHQAWAADMLRGIHEPVAKALRDDLETNFPSATTTFRIKKRYNMLEKLGRKPDKYKEVNQLTDVSGVMSLTNLAEIKQIEEHLRQTTDVSETENYIEQPGNFGYRALQLLSKDKKTGLTSEVQLKTPRQSRWAVWAHDIYKPPTRRFAQIVKQNKQVMEDYGKKMSDYYYNLDSGQTNIQKPECPEAVKEKYECLD